MKKIAITGGIGSGKSTVLSILKKKGFETIDSDEVVSVLFSEPEVQKQITSIFSSLNRELISKIVFSDKKKRIQLEKVLHPLTLNTINQKLGNTTGELAFIEVPLLFEAGLEKDFDVIILIVADLEKRLERLEKKGISREKSTARMNVQFEDREKIKKADFLLDNNSSMEELEERVENLLKEMGLN